MISQRKDAKNFFIKLAGMLALIAIVWNIPPAGALTEVGIHTLACFLGVVYGLCFLKEYGVYNLLIVILMGFSGAYDSMTDAFIASFGNYTFVLMFSVMLFVGIISYTGLAKTLALKMINAKFAAGRPWILTLVILVTASILSTFIPCLVVIVVMSELIIEIYRGLGLKGNRWTLFILADVAVLAIMGQDIMPFQLGQVLYFGILSSYDARLALSNYSGQFIAVQMIFQVLMLLFCWGLTWLFCRSCVEKLRDYRPSTEKFPLSPDQKIAFGILCGFVFLLLFPLVLPAGSALRNLLDKPTILGYAVLSAVIAMCIFKKDGTHFITFEHIIEGGVSWYMLLMLVSLGACVAPMTSKSTGIIQWLSDLLTPLCTGLSPFGAFAILVVFSVVATNLTDDIAVLYIVLPIMYVVCLATGLNPASVMTVLVPAISVGIILPSGTPYIAFIYGKEETGYIQKGPMMLWMVPRVLFQTAMYLTVGWAIQCWFPILI